MKNKLWLLLASVGSGAALPFAFAPFNWSWIAFVAPAVLLYTWLRSTPKQALYYGFVFGLGLFGAGASWIYVSIHNFGNANTFLAGLITVIFVALLSTMPALQGYVFQKFFKNRSTAISCFIFFPCIWVIWEAFRAVLFGGFPWLFLGYSQTSNPLLNGFAPIVGVYGLSFIVALFASVLVYILQPNFKITRLYAFLIPITLLSAGYGLSHAKWTHKSAKPLQVTLIQGNIPQSQKWNPQKLLGILERYNQETQRHWSSDLIVWPEAAVPTLPESIEPFIKTLDQQATEHNSTVFFGIPITDGQQHYYNSLLSVGKTKGMYAKHHLVPFGEYTPLKSMLKGLIKYLQIPMSDFSPGPEKQDPLVVNNIPITTLICYEIAFSSEVIKATKNSQIIIVISDDSWFGDSFAPAQQLEITQMRAIETGRYVIYSTNTGITAIISPAGKIIARIPSNMFSTLTYSVPAMLGTTPLVQLGYLYFWLIVYILLISAWCATKIK